MSLEQQLRDTLKSNGYPAAAELMDLSKFNNKRLRGMIESWKNFPACMSHYPVTLTPKNYPDI